MNVEQFTKLIQNPEYTRKKIRLRDGRILSYSECGNITTGMPVLFCFGLMTSSISVMFAHKIALQNNLRILAVDYPGIGESTFQENRQLSDWAADMTQFCDKVLHKDAKVRLLGHSLGGLHALALLSDPNFKKRVRRTVLMCPWTYLENGENYNPKWLNLARNLPNFLQSSVIPTVLSNFSAGTMILAGWANPKQIHLKAANQIVSYAIRQGHAGNEQMVRLALSKDARYLPSNLESPVVVYHGTEDRLVLAPSMAELVCRMRRRNCPTTYVVVKNADHNSVLGHPGNLSSVVGSLVGDPEAWAREVLESLQQQSRSSYSRRQSSGRARAHRVPPSAPKASRAPMAPFNCLRDTKILPNYHRSFPSRMRFTIDDI